MERNLKEKLLTSITATLLLTFTLLFFGPSFIYFNNIHEFAFMYSHIWYYFILVPLSISAVLFMIIFFLKEPFYEKAIALIFALGLLLWLQGNVLVWDYGLLDGREIIWSEHVIKGIIDTAIWIFVIALLFIKSSIVYKYITKASALLIVIQLSAFILTGFLAPPEPDWKKFEVSEINKYSFSESKNVIIMVVDSFQSDVFQEIINENEKYKEIFNGFTFFRNSLGGYPFTDLSVSLILTGQYYDNSTTFDDFKRSAFLSESSVPKQLKEAGFEVDLFPLQSYDKTLHFDKLVASNLLKSTHELDNIKSDLAYIFDLSLFSHVPNFAKRFIFNDHKWLFKQVINLNKTEINNYENIFSFDALNNSNDIRFINNMLREASATNNINTFKFYHLFTPHWPLTINENLQYERMDINRTNYKRQAKGALKITQLFIEKLKELGIYDNTMLMIVSDHGAGYQGQKFEIQENMYYPSNATIVSNNFQVAALPLILVKPFGESYNELIVSDSEVSLSDIPKTVFEELGIQGEFPGRSMFEIEEHESRERRFLSYTSTEPPYYGPMTEYIVRGFGYLNESWYPSFRQFTSSGIIDISPEPYQLGDSIIFGKEGIGKQYQIFGWSQPENGFTWTNSNKASLLLPIEEKINSNVALKITASAFLQPGKLESQRTVVSINGELVGEYLFDKAGEQEKVIYIKNELLEDNMLNITFEFPDAASPGELGVSSDWRKLGLAFKNFILDELTSYQFNTSIVFNKTGQSHLYKVNGWSNPEENGTWTNGDEASLIIPINQAEHDIMLRMEVSPFLPSGFDTQHVDIYVDDYKIGDWLFEKSGSQEKTLVIPKQYLSSSILKITFKLPDSISPKELGISNDSRKLAMYVRSLMLSEMDL